MWTNGYTRTSTTEHKRWRLGVLHRDQHRCRLRYPECLGAATIADHIVPTARGGDPLDLANGQAVCASCHATKTAAEATDGRRRKGRLRTREVHPGVL